MLKADFHAHSRQTQVEANYSTEELIDRAAELGYDVFTISEHYEHGCSDLRYRADPVADFPRLREYARKKGILLIPGVEAKIDGKEILVLNIKGDVREYLKTFEGLRELKKKDPGIAIVAPHPYFGKPECLKNRVFELMDILDAIEYCHCYLSFINWNRKAVKVAKKYKKPMVGTSDAHRFVQLDKTYTLVRSKKDTNSVIEAVKKGNIKLKTRPLTMMEFAQVFLFIIGTTFRKLYGIVSDPM